MKCWYCSLIKNHNPNYLDLPADFDLGSEAPRCSRHWRFLCDHCGKPFHFQDLAFCPKEKVPFCKKCALSTVRKNCEFWGWKYYWDYQCPYCGLWHPGIDYAEYSDKTEIPSSFLSKETYLQQPFPKNFLVEKNKVSDKIVEKIWNENAKTWGEICGDQGDFARRYFTDPILFRLLGEVRGQTILDAGCGQGYLSRMLAQKGAKVFGVENSKQLFEQAEFREKAEPAGIQYIHDSISRMPFLKDKSMDAIVCNNVFMYCQDIRGALQEFARILAPDGRIVTVFTHPCFSGSGTRWHQVPVDAPRKEEWGSMIIGYYFSREPFWFLPTSYEHKLLFFHRTLGDYFAEFQKCGFIVTDLVEPEVSPEAEKNLPPQITAQYASLPQSIALRLVSKTKNSKKSN